MQLSMRAYSRLSVLVGVLITVLAAGALTTGPRSAAADGLATVKTCDTNANSSSAVDCTIVLNSSIDSGGSWKVTITDTSAVVTACDGSAAGATCTTGSNTAEFDCPAGCQQNSTYRITVTASSATAIQEAFTVLSPGTLTGGTSSGGGGGSITVGMGAPGGGNYGNAMPVGGGNYGTSMPAVATATYAAPQQAMSYSAPPGGACVGGSYPGPNGCTSSGPLYPSVGGFYGGGYGGYGGLNGGGCLLGPALCGGAGFYGYNGCGFGFTCTTSCTTGTTCTVNIATSTKTCLIFGVTFNC